MTEFEIMPPEAPWAAYPERAAQAAFRRGRWGVAGEHLALGLPLLVLGVCMTGGEWTRGAALALASALLLVVFSYRGKAAGQFALSALLIGLFPLLLGACSNWMGHVCTGNACMSFCMPACAFGGAVAGVLASRMAQHSARPWVTLGQTGTLIVITGAIGCSCAGAGGIGAMVLFQMGVSALTLARLRRV